VAASIIERISSRLDGFVNALTGLGTWGDKFSRWKFEPKDDTDDNILEAMYEGDDIVARGVDKVPEHMLRRGFDLKLEGDNAADIASKMIARCDDLGVTQAFTDAMAWERLFGGSAIFVGINDGRPQNEVVDERSIRSVPFIYVVDKRDLRPLTYQADPGRKSFGAPATYALRFQQPPSRPDKSAKKSSIDNVGEIEIHASRLIIFPGMRTTQRRRHARQGWGVSLIDRAQTPIKQFASNWASVSHLMQDASQGVFKMQGLIDMIASGKSDVVLERMTLVDQGRSVARALLLDADSESFERKDSSLSGLPELLDRTMIRMAAAYEMPVTVLMGREPSGMNATGDSDIRNFYDAIAAAREKHLRPRLERLLKLLFLAQDGPTGGVEPDVWKATFPSLWQASPTEQADLELKHAQADATRIQSGVFLPEEVAISRYRPEGYSNEISIDLDARKASLDVELEKLASGEELSPVGMAPQPPPPGNAGDVRA
jgi:uncharacterized protein